MAYTVFADARAATLKPWWKGIPLTTDDIIDADLTTLIAEMSHKFDRYTGDHFEAENAATVVVDGEDEGRLWVPKRIRALTSVTVTYPGGAQVVAPATSYVANEVFADDFAQISHESYIGLIPGLYLWPSGWPKGTANVSILGNFSWGTTPDEVKRAVALMCWDRISSEGDLLRRSEPSGYASRGAPTGIIEVDDIIAFFRRVGRA